ncbi:class I SAM-dependent methyltransferase [Minwuia sp.]|uniref:class I SAM-dependent methyltransferase n=1 Tax=Minwuia sp. TaxID=2493630 RepID=UPI003A8C9890
MVNSAENVDLYDRHPINAAQILDAVAAAGKNPDNLKPADLRPHDQDHYGGEAVVHALAQAAGIGPGDVIADICAGMSGPARLIAETYEGSRVIALDFNFGRCQGAAKLNALVGMAERVKVLRCDVQSIPLATSCIDAAVSQEALLHVPDKTAVLKEAFRILKPGGRFAFTDLVARDGLTDADRDRLANDGMQMVTLNSVQDYLHAAETSGFDIVSIDDLSHDWIGILTERLEMYRQMRATTEKTFGEEAHTQYIGPYDFFVGLVQRGHLGGLRLALRKPG